MPNETRYLTNKSFKGNILLDRKEYDNLQKQNADLINTIKNLNEALHKERCKYPENTDLKAKLSQAEQEMIIIPKEFMEITNEFEENIVLKSSLDPPTPEHIYAMIFGVEHIHAMMVGIRQFLMWYRDNNKSKQIFSRLRGE